MERILRTMKGLSGFDSKQYQQRGLSKSTKFTFKDTSSAASDDIFHVIKVTSLKEPIPQNGQTHSSNSPATTDELFECV